MLFTGVAEDHVAFSFKEDASCFFPVLGFHPKARTTFKSKEEHCGLETRCVGPTWWMGKNRLEIEIKTRPQWQESAVEETAQSPQDRWKDAKNRGEWKEISREFNNWPLPLKKRPTPGRKAVKKALKEKVLHSS